MIGSDLIGKYVIVRCVDSGAFAGVLSKMEGRAVELKNVRRLWFWKGAASCSELAIRGPGQPEECMFPEEVSKIILLDAKEIIETTEVAEKIIKEVKPWKISK